MSMKDTIILAELYLNPGTFYTTHVCMYGLDAQTQRCGKANPIAIECNRPALGTTQSPIQRTSCVFSSG
jgi:hypothetical protein